METQFAEPTPPADTIRQIVHYTFATIRNKARTQVARASRGQCAIPRKVVSWYVGDGFTPLRLSSRADVVN